MGEVQHMQLPPVQGQAGRVGRDGSGVRARSAAQSEGPQSGQGQNVAAIHHDVRSR